MLVNTVTPKDLSWGWWQPWANTLAYYKFNWNLTDETWNSTASAIWTITYASVWDGQSIIKSPNNCVFTSVSESMFGSAFTISIWVQFSTVKSLMRLAWWCINNNAGTNYANIQYEDWFWWLQFYNYWDRTSWSWTPTANTWYNIIITWWWTNNDLKACVNWVDLTKTLSNYSYNTDNSTVALWGNQNYNSMVLEHESYDWYLDECILEDKEWTTTEKLDYFDLTKSKHGIS